MARHSKGGPELQEFRKKRRFMIGCPAKGGRRENIRERGKERGRNDSFSYG